MKQLSVPDEKVREREREKERGRERERERRKRERKWCKPFRREGKKQRRKEISKKETYLEEYYLS